MRQQWMKLAVTYWLDPKFKGLGTAHEALYIRLLGYTRMNDTGGFIPANAIAYCGRNVRNRDKVIADLVIAGLIERSTEDSAALTFPASWQQWADIAHQSPGQRSAKATESREIYNRSSSSSSLAQQQMRMDQCSECSMYAGMHLAECPTVAKTVEPMPVKEGSDDDGKADQHGG